MMEAEALTSNTLTKQSTPDDRESSQANARSFRELGVIDPICDALQARGITYAFPIQSLTLPIALGGHDIIGQARTGTGKTLAFGIPLLQRLSPGGLSPTEPAPTALPGATPAPTGPRDTRAPRALVIVPTRELAIQVAGDIRAAGERLPDARTGACAGARVLTVYGGRAYEPQIETLQAGVDVVVGTPGRLLDLARQRHLTLSRVETLVLDEADKMLDLGFLPDIERILALIPAARQTMLFSATMPGEVVGLARRYLRQPMNVRAEEHDETQLVPSTQHHVFRIHHLDKIEVLARVLQAKDRGLTMVFCQTKRAVDQVAVALSDRGFAVAAVHGDLGQGQRERALRAFRGGKVDVLVATDVAARGLDVDDVTHVVNYECPDDDKTYLHRIGRTGRAGRDGVAVTFADWRDLQRWKLIDAALGLGQPEPAEIYSTSEQLYGELRIPPSATGILPRAMRERAGLEAEAVEDIGETGRARAPRPRETTAKRGRVRHRTRSGRPIQNGSAEARAEGTGGAAHGGTPGGDAGTGTVQARAGQDQPARPRRRRRRSR